MSAERKYALDTNLLVRAFRSDEDYEQARRFHATFSPFLYLSAVVVQELRAGARPSELRALSTSVFAPFERRGRVFTPSYEAWKRAGATLAELVEQEGLELRSVSRSFVNDVVLAASCREAGIVLVTANLRDFTRIARVAPFDFVAPWPRPVV